MTVHNKVQGGLHVIGEGPLATPCSSTWLSCISVVLAGFFKEATCCGVAYRYVYETMYGDLYVAI